MKKLIKIMLVIAVLMAGVAVSQKAKAQQPTCVLSFIVVDSEVGMPIPGVKVIVRDCETGKVVTESDVTSDSEGNVRIYLPKSGKYEITVISVGFREYKRIVEVQAGEVVKNLDKIYLQLA